MNGSTLKKNVCGSLFGHFLGEKLENHREITHV